MKRPPSPKGEHTSPRALLASTDAEVARAADARGSVGETPPCWRPAAEQPIGGWYVTAREGEGGVNITQRIRDDEWVDGDGATTVTHSTFLPPTHYLPDEMNSVLRMHCREAIRQTDKARATPASTDAASTPSAERRKAIEECDDIVREESERLSDCTPLFVAEAIIERLRALVWKVTPQSPRSEAEAQLNLQKGATNETTQGQAAQSDGSRPDG